MVTTRWVCHHSHGVVCGHPRLFVCPLTHVYVVTVCPLIPAYQVLYPVIMFMTVCRTIWVRVRPNLLLVFKSYADDDVDRNSPNSTPSFISKFKSSWKDDYSLFSWADKGQWETVQTGDRQVSREGDWFRIGFEPVFVDYTKSGTWFIVISLMEVICRSSNLCLDGRGLTLQCACCV